MKKHIIIAMMMFVAVVLFACSEGGSGVSNKKKVRPVKQNAATEQAVQEQISSTEAFDLAEDYVSKMTLEEKVAQLFLISLSKLDKPKGQKSSYEVTNSLKAKLNKYPVGGVILNEKNVKNQHQTQLLVNDIQTSVSGPALYIAVEEDGGGDYSISQKCAELKAGGYNTPREMGTNMTPLQIYQKGVSIGNEFKSWGINLNLSPVADLAYEGNKQYGQRCLGSDEEVDEVEERLSSYVNGFRESGVSVTLQKFPGMGMVNGDMTEKICDNKESLIQLRDGEINIYKAGAKAGADCVMVGNAYMSDLDEQKMPAFISEVIVTKLLREEVGFDRVVMTSSLSDRAIVNNYSQEYIMTEALKVGCDMLVEPDNFEEACQTLIDDVRVGRLDEKVINTAVHRIIINKITAGIMVLNNKETNE